MVPAVLFERFRQAIADLPLRRNGEKYRKAELLNPTFLLFSESGLGVYYAPFHYLNAEARVVLMGLTPGWTQMEAAFRATRQGLARGLGGRKLFEWVEGTASFSGPMRKNLVEMLDGVGLNARLELNSCLDLFDAGSRPVHFTSIVSVPIFRKGENYRGYGPSLLQVPKLREWVAGHLAAELASIPNAVIVPLGKVADEAIQFLHSQGLISLDRCLTGFPIRQERTAIARKPSALVASVGVINCQLGSRPDATARAGCQRTNYHVPDRPCPEPVHASIAPLLRAFPQDPEAMRPDRLCYGLQPNYEKIGDVKR